MPELFIITGSNGAGKSTYKQALLPIKFRHLEIFDGDVFYSKKSTEFYKLYKSNKEARKLAEEALEQEFLNLVEKSILNRVDFAYEGHFTGNGAWEIPKRFKVEGFKIHLIFCGLNNLTKSIQRVDIRVKKGGFHVSPLAIENNFWGNMDMLDRNFTIFDTVEIVDTTNSIVLVSKIKAGKVVSSISSNQVPQWLIKGMPCLSNLIEQFNELG